MNTAQQSRLSIKQLRAELAGTVLGPDDPAYDDARRVFLPAVDRRPAAIVRPADAGEVAHVVSIARDTGLELAVRGGGHSNAGHGTSDGGIVLDLSGLTALEIAAGERIAHAAGGLTSGAVTAAAAPQGLAVGFGDTPSVGIGGLTLGGGAGYLVRRHGLTIDHLLGAEVVTADGRVLEVGADSHPDLFWAIRGGGGNFGVVTRFDYRLHPVDVVTGGMLALPATPATLAGLVAEAEAAPEELSLISNLLLAPPLPFVPPELVGKPLLLVQLVHSGPLEDGERAVAPLRALAPPVADFVRAMPFGDVFTTEAQGAPPRAVVRTFFSDSLDEDIAGELLDRLRASTAQVAAAQIRVLGGAVARVPAEATAYAHRHRRLMLNVAAVYGSPAEDSVHRAWAEEAASALRQGEDAGYVNFLGDEGAERVRAAYPGSTWDRLAEVKRGYDPENVFRLNQNVPPAEGR
ncbi:MAG TPA: FAD-binding oxidoreductase [Gaiellaceae bacterium]|nr:FAD-binding oxidoreductase [Gaiellaceae bacterium]